MSKIDDKLNEVLDIASFNKGDVSKLLKEKIQDVPNKISLLRLDTDWYQSTKDEMEILYPRISKNGILLVDDYGSWEGARKAIDEYFRNSNKDELYKARNKAISHSKGEFIAFLDCDDWWEKDYLSSRKEFFVNKSFDFARASKSISQNSNACALNSIVRT